MPKNIEVEIQSLTDKMTSQVEDFEKALSNASKGMDLKQATEMAEKLDLSLNDFNFKSGKYFFTNANAIKDAYYKYNEETLSKLDEEYSKKLADLN